MERQNTEQQKSNNTCENDEEFATQSQFEEDVVQTEGIEAEQGTEDTESIVVSVSDGEPAQDEDGDDDIIVLASERPDEAVEARKRADEMTNQVQRLQAEFDNYRRRTQESLKAVKEDARAELIEKLLPALDAFGQAAQIIKDKSVLDGVNMISARLSDVLAQYGLKKIEAAGKEFDPHFHNAVLTREQEGCKDTVVEVLQDGYMLGSKVIRAATVIVGA